jgi:hypothetical protein
VSRLWDEVFLPYVYVSCYDKPENIRYLFSPAFVFPLEVLCDRTYVNKRFVGGVVGSTEYFKIRYWCYNGCVARGGGEQGGGV